MTTPNNEKAIIDPEDVDDYPAAWGKQELHLSTEETEALVDGKVVAYYDGEYVTMIQADADK